MTDWRDHLPPVRGRLERDAPLAPYTWFRVGGPADLLFIPEDGTRVASVPDVERNGPAPRLTLPLQGVDRVIGRLAIANVAPDVYTEAQITIGRRIAEVLGPVVEHIVLLQKERDRLRRMAVLPEVSRVLGGSLDVGNIFEQLGAVVRRVLDFDRMIVRPIGPGGALQRTALLVGDLLADLHPEHRLADYSFGARLVARELVLIRDTRTELDALVHSVNERRYLPINADLVQGCGVATQFGHDLDVSPNVYNRSPHTPTTRSCGWSSAWEIRVRGTAVPDTMPGSWWWRGWPTDITCASPAPSTERTSVEAQSRACLLCWRSRSPT